MKYYQPYWNVQLHIRNIPDPFFQLKGLYAATLSSLNMEGTLDYGILIYN
jgi:hypothetical protein